MSVPTSQKSEGRRSRAKYAGLLMLGIALGQIVLYGPSLLGFKILLPLDILSRRGVYLPQTPDVQRIVIQDLIPVDLVTFYEPARRAAIDDLAHGRLPLWNPYRFAGAPAYRWCLSPPFWLGYVFASPVVLAWVQLLTALVAGSGMYLFCRRVLEVRFWPAAIAARCSPLTRALVVWQGFWLPLVMCWLPWILWAVDQTVQRPSGWGGPCLMLLTTVVLLGGAIDVAGETLLAAAVYAGWRLCAEYRKNRAISRALGGAGALSLAWLMGCLLAAPLLLPMLEYIRQGDRTERRAQGIHERPPVGLAALPQVVLPAMYGDTTNDSLRVAPDNLQESSAAAYAGLLATLFVAPLAVCSRRHRSMSLLCLLLIVLSLGWTLNLPGVTALADLPVLNLLSFNRLVFVAGFAILALAAVGLEVLDQQALVRRWWFMLPVAVLSVLCVWCCYRTLYQPEPIGTQIAAAIRQGKSVAHVRNQADLARVQQSYMGYYAVSAVWCSLAVTGWVLLWSYAWRRTWSLPVCGTLMLAELLWFAYGRNTQADPALYYPRLAILEQLAKAPPGRMLGCDCLPANIPRLYGLHDIRGYDGIDPDRLTDLLRRAADPNMPPIRYAFSQWFVPQMSFSSAGEARLSPLLDMLHVRYVLLQGQPPPNWKGVLQDDGYWVLENRRALPRVYVPETVEQVADETERLRRMSASSFDARRVAYVESPVEVPSVCRGTATVVADTHNQLVVETDMQTAGLVVLADRWDPGWKVTLNGVSTAVLIANHALRGVPVPAGHSRLEFRYAPDTLAWGLRLAMLAGLVSLGWAGAVAWRRDAKEPPTSVPPCVRAAFEKEREALTDQSHSKSMAYPLLITRNIGHAPSTEVH